LHGGWKVYQTSGLPAELPHGGGVNVPGAEGVALINVPQRIDDTSGEM
jgi:hypothetical protein